MSENHLNLEHSNQALNVLIKEPSQMKHSKKILTANLVQLCSTQLYFFFQTYY